MINIANYEDFITKDYKIFCNEINEEYLFHRKQWKYLEFQEKYYTLLIYQNNKKLNLLLFCCEIW